jgi:NaMN:DMB phosphoribosyltransferase
LRAIAAIGDPMMPAVAGLIRGMASSGPRIVLAGGTQIIAVFTILTHLDIDTGGISIATTKYVSQDRSIDFDAVIRDLGCPIHVVDPGFAGSRLHGLHKYEAGEVKEGVGAGGVMYAAAMLGVTQREMLGAVEAVYEGLMGG